MTGMPPPTLYHRWLGWHATDMRRAASVLSAGLVAALIMVWFVTWSLALVGGWDAAALTFLLATWPIILRAEGARAAELASREDDTKNTARALLVSASIASLLGAGYGLHLAGHHTGVLRLGLTSLAVLTVVLSWTLVNTVYTLRYADEHHRSTHGGIEFGGQEPPMPSYRDFAYVAFTIGMTYQVSDTTLRDPLIRRSALGHAALSYLFGVVIVAGLVNLTAGLIQ
jgi:uncharacterized membrane protein